jgi:hypothetical protein
MQQLLHCLVLLAPMQLLLLARMQLLARCPVLQPPMQPVLQPMLQPLPERMLQVGRHQRTVCLCLDASALYISYFALVLYQMLQSSATFNTLLLLYC